MIRAVLPLFLAASALAGVDDTRLLSAIAAVESGGRPLAVGKAGEVGQYQMRSAAWTDANRQRAVDGLPAIPWSAWRSTSVQDAVAKAFLCRLRTLFRREGINTPTPAQIASAWNLGFAKARRLGFPASDYARRVEALAR